MIKDNRTAFYDFKDKIMKTEESYLIVQQISVNQPLLTAFGNTVMARHAEDLYFPSSPTDNRARVFGHSDTILRET